MKYFLLVIGELAQWQPPEGIHFVFAVNASRQKINIFLRHGEQLDSGSLDPQILPWQIRELLNSKAAGMLDPGNGYFEVDDDEFLSELRSVVKEVQ